MSSNKNIKFESPYKRFIIGELWPCVKSIKISVEETNNSIDNAKDSPKGRLYVPTNSCKFTFPCINPTCTCGNIDLSDEVSQMIQEQKTELKGEKICEGKGGKLYNYRCMSKLKYEITIEYNETV